MGGPYEKHGVISRAVIGENKQYSSGALVGQQFGDHILVAFIAEGGTSEIYLAKPAKASAIQRLVVIKTLLPCFNDDSKFVKMFLDEARTCAGLDHSNIVRTISLGQSQDRYFIEMEYLPGVSMADVFATGPVPWGTAFAFASQVTMGLSYAHRKIHHDGTPLHLVHRDISPENLIVSYQGNVKVIDFGIAKSEQRETQTEAGTIKGKFSYMSPEQVLAKPMDCRSDLFSMGTILHELISGKRLFKRGTIQDTFHLIVNGVIPPLTEIPEYVNEAVLKCLAVNPDDRFQSADELNDTLRRCLHRGGKQLDRGSAQAFMAENFSLRQEEDEEKLRSILDIDIGSSAASKKAAPSQSANGGEFSELPYAATQICDLENPSVPIPKKTASLEPKARVSDSWRATVTTQDMDVHGPDNHDAIATLTFERETTPQPLSVLHCTTANTPPLAPNADAAFSNDSPYGTDPKAELITPMARSNAETITPNGAKEPSTLLLMADFFSAIPVRVKLIALAILIATILVSFLL